MKHNFVGNPVDGKGICNECGMSPFSVNHNYRQCNSNDNCIVVAGVHSVNDNPPIGSPKFHKLLKEIGDLHDKKQLDYGTSSDPYYNIRASEDLGIPGYKGSILRANDKMTRLKKFCKDGVLSNESARDSMLDGAIYLLMAAVLFDECQNK